MLLARCQLRNTPRFSRVDDTTTRGQRTRGVETAKLKKVKTFIYSKAPIYWKTPECCASREEFTAPLRPSAEGKENIRFHLCKFH